MRVSLPQRRVRRRCLSSHRWTCAKESWTKREHTLEQGGRVVSTWRFSLNSEPKEIHSENESNLSYRSEVQYKPMHYVEMFIFPILFYDTASILYDWFFCVNLWIRKIFSNGFSCNCKQRKKPQLPHSFSRTYKLVL